jgi:hypothetical protein
MTDDVQREKTPGVPAGWYADPAGEPLLRYWDGTKFTNATAPAPAGAAAAPSSGPNDTSDGASRPASQHVEAQSDNTTPGWVFPLVGALVFLGIGQYLTTDHAFRNMPIGVLEFSSKIQVTNPCRAAHIRALHELDQVYSSALAGQEGGGGDLDDLEGLVDMCDVAVPRLENLSD